MITIGGELLPGRPWSWATATLWEAVRNDVNRSFDIPPQAETPRGGAERNPTRASPWPRSRVVDGPVEAGVTFRTGHYGGRGIPCPPAPLMRLSPRLPRWNWLDPRHTPSDGPPLLAAVEADTRLPEAHRRGIRGFAPLEPS